MDEAGLSGYSSLTSPLTVQGALTYQLPSDVASWSSVFQQLESNKSNLGIEDYFVGQTTLEQVFQLSSNFQCQVAIIISVSTALSRSVRSGVSAIC